MKWHRKWLRRLVSPASINRVNAVTHLDDRLYDLEARRAQLAEILLRPKFEALFASTARHEFRVFSQNGEDGVLLWLLSEIGAPVKTFVEIGIENGLECNTAVLAFVLGWDGLMVEADARGAAAARKVAERMLRGRSNRLEIREQYVRPADMPALTGSGPLGVLSIDVDGMDYWLWKAVSPAAPDIVVIEYNASMGPSESITVPYQDEFSASEAHPSGYYHGASLTALEKLGREKGYSLVAVEEAGVNAFFVRDAIRPPALRPRASAELYRPHAIRCRRHSPAEQWALIRDLPYERV